MSFTNSNGNQVYDDQTSMTCGAQGPVLMQDVHLLDKLAHFNRERIPERVVHAKGAGAHGYFEVTHDITHLTKAKFLNKVGKRTPIFTRFSRVAGESGAADSDRDPRGFAVKFYTEEGNWDMVGNNTPIFFLRDTIKFPDFIHTQKRNPQTHLKDPNMFWDFLSLTPESIHQVTMLFTNRGTPDGYRHMHGYFSHTLQLVNEAGERCYAKWHFRSCQGIRNLKASEAMRIAGEDPDYFTRDLFDAIERGEHPCWSVKIQVMPLVDVPNYRWDPLDVTKVWPHKDYPLQPVGRMVLDRNPTNYFAEVEQAAFAPSNMVQGIEPTADRMLQGRLFSYHDAHLYRLGVNYKQLPINQAKCPVKTYQQDGAGCYEIKEGPNYAPNSLEETSKTGEAIVGCPFSSNAVYTKQVKGDLLNHGPPARYIEPIKDDDFVQAGNLFRLLPDEEKADLISNIASFLSKAKKDIQYRMITLFEKVDPAYGKGVKDEIAKCS